MNKPIPRLNRICFEKNRKYEQDLLYKHVSSMKGQIDNKIPVNYDNYQKNIHKKKNHNIIYLEKLENYSLIKRIQKIESSRDPYKFRIELP